MGLIKSNNLGVCLLYWRADVVAGLLGVSEGAISSRGDAVTLHKGLGKALAGLQLSRFGRGSKTRHSCSRQVVYNTWKRHWNKKEGLNITFKYDKGKSVSTFSYLRPAVPQVQPQPTPHDDPYRTEPI